MAARATISQAGSVVSSVNNNAITARLKRQLYKDVWPWTFLRNSVDGALGINVPRLGANGEIRVMEGTTNLLPAGAENFVTGWTNGTGETCTVTDYPVNIPGVGDVIAKRIVGNGAGSDTVKRFISVSGRPNPHQDAISVWAMVLSGSASFSLSGLTVVAVPSSITRLVSTINRDSALTSIFFLTPTAASILDIVVYAPQIEAKTYATDYVAPGTTRAAESLAIPVGATQKNLLTQNQATGGDTLGNTTGFTGVASAIITRDTTEKWNGTGSIKVVTPNAAPGEGFFTSTMTGLVVGKIYTVSTMIKTASSYVLTFLARDGGGSTMALAANRTVNNSAFAKESLVFTATATTMQFLIYTSTKQAATFWIDGLQLEEGTTASDWALPEVNYSNAIINPAQPFSIEFDAIPTSDDKSITTRLFSLYGNATNYVALMSSITTGNYYVTYRSGAGSARNIISAIPAVSGVKKNFKISVSGSTVTFTIDGVDLPPVTFDGGFTLPIDSICRIGTEYTGGQPRNAYYSNFRIRKGVALSAAERAYTGQLKADQFTTFFAPWSITA